MAPIVCRIQGCVPQQLPPETGWDSCRFAGHITAMLWLSPCEAGWGQFMGPGNLAGPARTIEEPRGASRHTAPCRQGWKTAPCGSVVPAL